MKQAGARRMGIERAQEKYKNARLMGRCADDDMSGW